MDYPSKSLAKHGVETTLVLAYSNRKKPIRKANGLFLLLFEVNVLQA
jgi:hypothetical protein